MIRKNLYHIKDLHQDVALNQVEFLIVVIVVEFQCNKNRNKTENNVNKAK